MKSEQLCWECQNATSLYKCSWAVGEMPEGVKIDKYNHIVKCPNFIKDIPQKTKSIHF